MITEDQTEKKFILMLVTLLGMMLFLMGGLIFISSQNQLTFLKVTILVIASLLMTAAVLLLATILTIIGLWYNKAIPKPLVKLVGFTVPLFYPLMVVLGKGLKIDKNTLRRAYTLIHNKLVMGMEYNIKGEDILILTPHCLQKSFCPHKITHDVDNCKRCGLCNVHQLLELKGKYGVQFRVVTGGTLARRLILNSRPKAIIAIACERDLVSGLMDVKKIPVYAVINQRPEGPCINTRVNLVEVEKAINHFIKE